MGVAVVCVLASTSYMCFFVFVFFYAFYSSSVPPGHETPLHRGGNLGNRDFARGCSFDAPCVGALFPMKEGMHSSHQSLLKVFVCAVVLQFGSAFVGPTTARFVPSCSAGAEHAISRSLATRPLPPRRQRFARQVPGRGLSVGECNYLLHCTARHVVHPSTI